MKKLWIIPPILVAIIVIFVGVNYALSKNQTVSEPGTIVCDVEFTLQYVTPVGLFGDTSTVMLTPERTFFAGPTEYRILQIDPNEEILAFQPDSLINKQVRLKFKLLPSSGIIAKGELIQFTVIG